MSKVLVGIYWVHIDPFFFQVLLDFLKENHDIVDVYQVYRRSWAKAQELIIRKALKEGYEYVLFFEDDTTHIPPGALQKLIEHDKDIISPFVMSRHPYKGRYVSNIRVLSKGYPTEKGSLSTSVWHNQGLMKVGMIPFQFTPMKTEIFRQLKQPWFRFGEVGAPDSWLCEKCMRSGIDV